MRAERTVPLAKLERLLQSVVVHPGRIEDAVAYAATDVGLSADAAEGLFLPSRTLGVRERLEIYKDMYPMRMVDALAADYPYVKAWVGDHLFEHLVEDYVQLHPSTSYTLNRLGDAFPSFLRGSSRLKRPAPVADLAVLELAMTQAFDEKETPAATPADFAAIPSDAWERARFEGVAALRLVAVGHPVGLVLDAVRGEAAIPPIRPKASHYALWRRDYSVYRLDLTPAQHRLLSALVGGQPLGAALREAMPLFRRRRGASGEEELFGCFQLWGAKGLFRSVRAGRASTSAGAPRTARAPARPAPRAPRR